MIERTYPPTGLLGGVVPGDVSLTLAGQGGICRISGFELLSQGLLCRFSALLRDSGHGAEFEFDSRTYGREPTTDLRLHLLDSAADVVHPNLARGGWGIDDNGIITARYDLWFPFEVADQANGVRLRLAWPSVTDQVIEHHFPREVLLPALGSVRGLGE